MLEADGTPPSTPSDCGHSTQDAMAGARSASRLPQAAACPGGGRRDGHRLQTGRRLSALLGFGHLLLPFLYVFRNFVFPFLSLGFLDHLFSFLQ